MVINGSSVNDAVSTIDKPATGRVTLNRMNPEGTKAPRSVVSMPIGDVKKWLTIPQSPSIYISQNPRYPADWDL
jgi:hypothetical protein